MAHRRLQIRIDRLQGQRPKGTRSSIDWSLLTDAEFERLEPFALRAATLSDVPTFMATLAPADDVWLTTIAAKLDLVERLGTMRGGRLLARLLLNHPRPRT